MTLVPAAIVDVWPLFVGAAVIGVIHGVEPGHGWPIAATYALDRQRKWLNGFLASFLLGVGHLVSSIAVVLVYFLAISYFDLTQVNDPLTVFGLRIGGPVSIVAGVLLILLGVREYRRGHAHDHGDDDHGDDDHGDDDHGEHGEHVHEHGGHVHEYDGGHADHDHVAEGGWWDRAKARLPFVGGHAHDHDHDWDPDTTGLAGILWTALILGFAHEEEFQIIALCTGSPDYCLPLMLVYAASVILALVGLTLGLIASYMRYEDRVERYAEYFPTVSAVVLVAMGLGFIVGVF